MIIDSFTKLGNKTVLSYPLERTYKDIKRMRYLIKILDSICKVEYIGLENLSDNPCILTPNHSSHLDIVCIYKALMECFGYDKLYKMCCLAAKELEVREKGKYFVLLVQFPLIGMEIMLHTLKCYIHA